MHADLHFRQNGNGAGEMLCSAHHSRSVLPLTGFSEPPFTAQDVPCDLCQGGQGHCIHVANFATCRISAEVLAKAQSLDATRAHINTQTHITTHFTYSRTNTCPRPHSRSQTHCEASVAVKDDMPIPT